MEDSARPQHTKRGRQDDADAKALRELEAEFDEILPAQFPEQFSTLCDASLNPGETLVLGGFRKADGNYEFTMLEAEPLGVDGAPLQKEGAAPQYRIKAKTLAISHEASLEMGLDTLISPAKTRIQKNIVFPAGEFPRPDGYSRAMAMPSVTVRPDVAATISIGTDYESYVISLIVSPQDASATLRIRTRVESPSEHLPLR